MFKEEGHSMEFILSGVEGSKGSALPRSGTASCYKFEKIHKKQQKYCIFNLCCHT